MEQRFIVSGRYSALQWRRHVKRARSTGYIIARKIDMRNGTPVDTTAPVYRFHWYRDHHRGIKLSFYVPKDWNRIDRGFAKLRCVYLSDANACTNRRMARQYKWR